MITLWTLRKLAQKLFPEREGDLLSILSAWATEDPGQELEFLLEGTGVSTAKLDEIVRAFWNIPDKEDKEILKDCIVNTSGTGSDLLQTLARKREHRITRELARQHLNFQRLLQNIERGKSASPTMLVQIKVNQNDNPILEYGRDLTAMAREGAFDDLCDRPEEVESLLEILLRKNKGNCVITGHAGVGKTALVELFSRTLVRGEIPSLSGTRILEVSMSKIVAGTRYRGDFEERMHRLISAAQKNKPVILFIDEIHLIWGAGKAEGVLTDASNILKPFLARKEIQVIGATTVQEYHQSIARDEALSRRFQELCLKEPNAQIVWGMVNSQARALSEHHGVEIEENLVREAIELTDEHILQRWQPDKSVDILDIACTHAVREKRSALALSDLLSALARQTGKSVEDLSTKDRMRLRNLAARLKARIVGQDHAIEKISATLSSRRQGLSNNSSALGKFLFVGETGVGKTEMARAISMEFFGSLDSLLCLVLSECADPSGIHKIIGSPQGFLGSEKEGVLVDWLHHHPGGVILLDEIEKAHREVQNLFLGMLDKGCFYSGKGERMDTRQCVVVLTSNALRQADLSRGSMGFGLGEKSLNPIELLSDHFPKEFLARLDEVILFHSLGIKEMREILRLRLKEAIARLKKKNIRLQLDEERMLSHLFEELENNQGGARGIAKLLETRLLHPISLALLESKGENKGPICIKIEEDFYENGRLKV